MGSNFAHRRTRFLLLIVILAVCGYTLASFVARQRGRRVVRPLPEKIAAGVDQQTQAFSLSRSLGNQALYKIQASQVTNFKETGKTLLRDVSIQVFGKKGNREDHITAKECEFDPATGMLFIPGEVTMELQAPPDAVSSAGALQPNGPVHVVTSALSFNQNTGVAATDREVRFRFSAGEGSSQGAVYDPQEGSINMKAQVRLTLRRPPATLEAKPGAKDSRAITPTAEEDSTQVAASSLRFVQGESVVHLSAPVEINQGMRQIQAGESEILLDEQQRARSAALRGGVHWTDRSPLRVTELQANESDLEFTPQGKVRRLVMEASAAGSGRPVAQGRDAAGELSRWASSSPNALQRGEAQRVEMLFDESSGQLNRVLAGGQVRMAWSPAASVAPLPLLARWKENDPLPEGSRLLRTEQAEMEMSPQGDVPRELRTQRASTIQLYPAKPGEDRRTVEGETFQMQFGPQGELSEFTADQKVRVETEGAAKSPGKRVSTSDHLTATFDRATHSISHLQQWGSFQYQDPERQARAERADYVAASDRIVLEGAPQVWSTEGKLTAQKITLLDAAGQITAEKQVAVTYFSSSTPGSPPATPTNVVADRMDYQSKTGQTLFQGNARLWQGNDLIEAARLELDKRQQTMTARNGVYSVFPGRNEASSGIKLGPEKRKPVRPETPSGPVEIRADSLTYREQNHRARYQGAVQMRNASATVASTDLEIVFHAPASTTPPSVNAADNRQIERAIATGKVVITQPGRKATGERAEYTPAEQKIILSGNLAAISDVRKGSTQGTRLTYFTGDDTILVQGEPGLPAETRRQVQR